MSVRVNEWLNKNNVFKGVLIYCRTDREKGHIPQKPSVKQGSPTVLHTQTKTNSVARVRKRTIYRPRDRRLSAKLVPTLADRGCRVVSATNSPQSFFNLGFLDRYYIHSLMNKF
jgi:hypothetical protein